MAAVLAAAATVALLVVYSQPDSGAPGNRVTVPPQAEVIAPRPDPGRVAISAGGRKPVVNVARRRAGRPRVQEETQLRPSSDAAAIERFMAAIGGGSLDAGSLIEPQAAEIRVADLSIMPLAIDPITADQ